MVRDTHGGASPARSVDERNTVPAFRGAARSWAVEKPSLAFLNEARVGRFSWAFARVGGRRRQYGGQCCDGCWRHRPRVSAVAEPAPDGPRIRTHLRRPLLENHPRRPPATPPRRQLRAESRWRGAARVLRLLRALRGGDVLPAHWKGLHIDMSKQGCRAACSGVVSPSSACPGCWRCRWQHWPIGSVAGRRS